MKKYNFPIIRKVYINHFSLYNKADYIDINLNKNVYCLAGANGLGKSTFINIINFALTGIVKNPDRAFTWYNSISAFYNKSKGFASNYFDGRITEENHELAEVTIEFTIDKNSYVITRGFFEPDELRYFSKKKNNKSFRIPDKITNSELNDLYKSEFTKDVNLSDFDQFVFLQLYFFTFDETHQLLFWDESLIERVLYLFFGVDAQKAKQADQLRKEYNKFDSEVRNLQFQITRTRGQIKSVQQNVDEIDLNNVSNIELYESHKNLLENSDELTDNLNNLAHDIKDIDLNISDLSLKTSALRGEYEYLFNQTLTNDSPLEKNPTIIQILNDLKLKIFTGKDYTELIDNLIKTIKDLQILTNENKTKDIFTKLKTIDTQLTNFSKQIKQFQLRKDRLIDTEKHVTKKLNDLNIKITNIEKDNINLLRSIHQSKNDNGIHQILKSYEDTIEHLSQQKDEAYRKRNKAKQELEPLELEMNKGYLEAEKHFIPLFNQYAKSFLGLDINIELASSSRGASISIYIDNTKRKVSHQLSESQRYFVDIALRMAIIDLCTLSASIFIDTPEGSLDIAYESRAGKMFADFAKNSFKLILTTNINSSQLLKELAMICGKNRMKIERMTDWTTLSEIQQLENNRLENAFSELERILN